MTEDRLLQRSPGGSPGETFRSSGRAAMSSALQRSPGGSPGETPRGAAPRLPGADLQRSPGGSPGETPVRSQAPKETPVGFNEAPADRRGRPVPGPGRIPSASKDSTKPRRIAGGDPALFQPIDCPGGARRVASTREKIAKRVGKTASSASEIVKDQELCQSVVTLRALSGNSYLPERSGLLIHLRHPRRLGRVSRSRFRRSRGCRRSMVEKVTDPFATPGHGNFATMGTCPRTSTSSASSSACSAGRSAIRTHAHRGR